MSPIKPQTFILSKLITVGLILALLFGALAYISFQARYIIGGPEITLDDAPDVIQNDRVIVLRGTANNITAIYLNGRPIVTDESGVFAEQVVLENGYSVVRIDAVDLYGRATYVERPFVYSPEGNVTEKDDKELSLSNGANLNPESYHVIR